MDLDSVADELYGLAPEEFVARRTELERAAKASGDRTLAGLVRQLAKPTRSAWLVNLLSREQPETVSELLDLAELLAEGMRSLSAPELQQLTRQRSQLVTSITRAALAVGNDRGHRASEAARAEVADTLTAALADREVAEQVVAGRLTRAVSWSGFGLPGSEDAPSTAFGGRKASAAKDRSASDRTGGQPRTSGQRRTSTEKVAPVVELAPHRREAERARARKRRKQADDEQRRAAAAAERSTSRVTEAEEQAELARRESAPADDDLRQAEAALAEAERTVQKARREHDRAAGIAERAAATAAKADARLRELRDEHERARTRLTGAADELRAAEESLSALGEEPE